MCVCVCACVCVCVGARESAINRAEGLRQSKILASEAMRIEQVNMAKGECHLIPLYTWCVYVHALLMCKGGEGGGGQTN